MALKYKAKRPELIDAFASAGISTAAQLAAEVGISIGTAQSVLRGDEVSLQVAIEVIHKLQGRGADVSVSTAFEEVSR